MTPNEAYEKVKSETGEDSTSCFEMDKLYLFGNDKLVNMFSVNKSTGEVKVFNPILDCRSVDFANKKAITDFR